MKLSERMLARAERMRKRGHRAYAMFLRRDAGKVAQLEEENAALKHRLGLCEMALRVAHLPLPPYDALLTSEESDDDTPLPRLPISTQEVDVTFKYTAEEEDDE